MMIKFKLKNKSNINSNNKNIMIKNFKLLTMVRLKNLPLKKEVQLKKVQI